MKLFIVFYPDRGSREDCSVYYCWLVKASTKKEAIKKVVSLENTAGAKFGIVKSEEDYDAEEKEVIE